MVTKKRPKQKKVTYSLLRPRFCGTVTHRVPGRELSEFLSANKLCGKANSPSLSQNSPIFAVMTVRLSEFSSSRTVLSKQYSARFRHAPGTSHQHALGGTNSKGYVGLLAKKSMSSPECRPISRNHFLFPNASTLAARAYHPPGTTFFPQNASTLAARADHPPGEFGRAFQDRKS